MSDDDELWAAARNGDEARVAALLEGGGVNVNHVSAAGSTALCEASEKGHAQIVASLCAVSGVNVSATDRLGWSPLHLAAYYAHADVVRTLLAHHASLDATNADKSTPLHLAALANALEVVRIFVPMCSPALLAATDARGKRAVELASDADVVQALQSPLSPSSRKPASCELCGAVKVAARVQKGTRELWTCRPCAMSMQVANNSAASAAAPVTSSSGAPPPSATLSRGPPPRPKLPAVARTGPSGPRPPRGGGGGGGGSGVVRGAMERAFSQEIPDFPTVPGSVDSSASSPPPVRPTRVLSPSPESAASPHKAALRTLSPPPRKPHEASMGRQAGAATRRGAPSGMPAARRLPGRSPFGATTIDLPTSVTTPLHSSGDSAATASTAAARDPPPAALVPRVSRIPLPSFSTLPASDTSPVSPLSSQAPPPAAAAVDSPSLAPNRDKSGVLNLKIAELEVQNKKLHQELQELKARGGGGGGGGGDSSTESLLRSRVKQLEDQLDLMELALPIKSDEPTKASFDTVTAVYFKSLSKLDESTLQTLLPQNKHVSSLVVDALERQRANDGEVVGLAAVALVQAIAAAVGKLDERGGGAAATDATKKSVMTNRLTSSGLVSLMSQLAHLAADSASCTVAVHRAARAVFVAMLAAGLMVRAADGGLAPVPSAPDADESRRKRLERNLSSMRFTTEAKPLPPAPGKEAPLSPSLSSRTQYQSMPGRPGVANPDPAPPQKQAPTKASAAAVPTLDIPRGRANGPTRTRGRRASSVEAPRFQQAAEKKAAVESRTLSPGRRVMGVAAPKQKKQSEKTSEPMRRDLRNMGGVPTVDMEGALLLRSTAAADASGRLFADASKAIDTSFSLVNVLLLSDGHLEYRKMPTGSAQEAKEAAASLRGQSLSAVCARLLKDCVKLSEVVTSDVAAARDTAKNMIFKVRELKRVVTDVSAFAPRFGAPEDFATRCEAAMTALSTSVANLVKLAKEELLDDTVKLDIDNRAKVSRQAVAAAMRGLLDVLPAQCRAIVTSPESSSADGAAPLEAGVVLKVSGERFEVVIDSTSQCLFRLRDKTSASGGLQFKSRDDDVMMEWVNAIEAHGVNTVL